MLGLGRYVHWLHTRWPAGGVERLPEVREDGTTTVPGVRVVGDLTGIPLLKLAADTGARAVQAIAREEGFAERKVQDGVVDVAIVGGGVSGIAAALEAIEEGLSYVVFEAAEPFQTIASFPRRKPIYTYPTEMTPAGRLQLTAEVKEGLLEELERQREDAGVEVTRSRVDRIERRGGLLHVHHGEPAAIQKAHRVIIAIGRSGNYRKLGVPGEDLDKVTNRLYDPLDHTGQDALVVGGGDSAVETAIALAIAGARVTLSYRGAELTRPKPENLRKLTELVRDPGARVSIERPSSERVNAAADPDMVRGIDRGSIELRLTTTVKEIGESSVALEADGEEQTVDNDVVFVMIGREAPLGFFRRTGIPIRGEWRAATWIAFLSFFAACVFVYNWKSGGWLTGVFQDHGWFPFNVAAWLSSLSAAADDPSTLLGTLRITMEEPGFYYSTAYTLAIIIFGWQRIRRRRTPYVTRQTLTLLAVQVLPLFLLPYVLLPLMGHNGWFDTGTGKWIADQLFPEAGYGHGREYWRSFGFILAWPLFIWNFFTSKPMWGWLIIGCIQTFVIIPLMIRRWGKGAYCGWICSCGALAETMGDLQRHKMPHGPRWNRLNMAGQVILWVAALMFLFRVVSWITPRSGVGKALGKVYSVVLSNGLGLDYYHAVDIFLAGAVGVGVYFWLSGRVWCRFFCPLAALMHLYARAFSRFRIFADKKRCISCNQCTAVCHQGIDIMSFANKGLPMEDPECVRCSACVVACPTGVLSFGRVGPDGKPVLDRIAASPVQSREGDRKRLPIAG